MLKFNETIQKEQKFIYPGDSKEYSGILTFEMKNSKFTSGTGAYSNFNPVVVFVPFSKRANFQNPSFRREYFIFSDDVIDANKYNTFRQSVIGNILNNKGILGKSSSEDVTRVFDGYWEEIAKPLFDEENKITKAFIDDMEKVKLKDYMVYTPFPKKKRVFTYTTVPISNTTRRTVQETLIKSFMATTNIKTDQNSWNDEAPNGAGENSTKGLISKAKLN